MTSTNVSGHEEHGSQISVARKKRAGQLAIISLALVMAAALTLLTVDYIGKTRATPVTPLSAVQQGAVIPFSAKDLVNPKRGQYQDLGVTLYPQSTTGSYPAWPGTDDAGSRFLWSQIQPTSANSYDFTVIDNAIAAAHAHNQRFHFRVMSFASERLQRQHRHRGAGLAARNTGGHYRLLLWGQNVCRAELERRCLPEPARASHRRTRRAL